jgi:hypothetical protein
MITLLQAIFIYSIIGSLWHIIMLRASRQEAVDYIEAKVGRTYTLILLWPVTMILVIISQIRKK